MVDERKDIEFPMWRKKVDSALLERGHTPIPAWVNKIWDISGKYADVESKKSFDSIITIKYKKKNYQGHVSKVKKDSGFIYRLYINSDLQKELQRTYLVSFMRSYEAKLAKVDNPTITHKAVEKDLSLWEFLDIEFDADNKAFIFTSHFTIKPDFPNLYKAIIDFLPISKSDSILNKTDNQRIRKYSWFPKSEFNKHITAENVIYTLIDTVNKQIYVGRAKNLLERYNSSEEHHAIPSWDYFKYNVLSEDLIPHIDQIERMIIRDMAGLFENTAQIDSFNVSSYKLVNTKIDTKI